MAKTCKNCGEKLSEEALFCPNCGAPAEPCGPVNDDPVENFKANNSVPVPEAPVMSDTAPEKEQNAAGYTPAPEKIPEPEFATGPAPAPAAEASSSSKAAAAAEGISSRNIALCIILSIVTCGIYGLYWLYKLNDEVNTLAEEPNATSGGLVILFTVITCGIYGWYWNYKMGERVDRIKGTGDSNKVLFIVLAIFGLCIVNYAIMQDTINDSVGA